MIDLNGKTVLDFAKTKNDVEFLKNKYGCNTEEDLKKFVSKLSDEANANEIVDFAQVTNKKELLEVSLEYAEKVSEIVTDVFNKTGDFTN